MAQVHLRGVKKTYDNKIEVIHGIDMEIADGEFIVIVGPSGCGKSTLLRMVAGLERITGGEVAIGDRVVNGLEPKDRDIAMVFQNYALYPHMSVYQNMAYGLKIKKMPKDEIERRVQKAAKILELGTFLQRLPRQLSGGQRQRVAMGRAIVREPAVFLFDEPLSNLDAKLRVQMRLEIKRLQRELGVTSIYVTHDQVEAMTLADRVAVMRKGVVQQVASPRELYNEPVNLFVAGFIGSPAMNMLSGELEGDTLKLPMVDVPLPEDVRARLGSSPPQRMVVGIRPEHFQDAELVREARQHGPTFHEKVDVVEWLGSELYVHFDVGDSPGADDLPDVSDLGMMEVPGAGSNVVARIDPTSRIEEGREAELWLDARRILLFDPQTGANLLHRELAAA